MCVNPLYVMEYVGRGVGEGGEVDDNLNSIVIFHLIPILLAVGYDIWAFKTCRLKLISKYEGLSWDKFIRQSLLWFTYFHPHYQQESRFPPTFNRIQYHRKKACVQKFSIIGWRESGLLNLFVFRYLRIYDLYYFNIHVRTSQ